MSLPTSAERVGCAHVDFDAVLVRLTEEIEREALVEARRTLVTLLRLRPKDPAVLEAQAYLESQKARAAETNPLRRFQGHTSWVNCVAFAADGATAVTGSGGELGPSGFTEGEDRSIRIWNVADGKAVHVLKGHSSLVTCVAAMPQGHVLSGSRGGTVCLWDVAAGQPVRIYHRSKAQVFGLAVFSDGARFLTASEDTFIRLWDVETAQRIRKCAGHSQPVTSVAFFPDGQRALSGSQDQTVRQWNLDRGYEVCRYEGHTMTVMSVAVSPDGRRLLSAGGEPDIRLWDTNTAHEIRRFAGHTDAIHCVVFTPDGRCVVSGSADKTIRLWDVETGRELCCFAGHGDTVRSLAVSPDGRLLLSGSNDKTACLWSLPG